MGGDRMVKRATVQAAAALALLFVSGCAVTTFDPSAAQLSPPPVGAATEERLEEGVYRVTFVARGDYTRAERQAGVLRRAAELTLEKGREYFVVRERESLYDSPPPSELELGVGIGVFGGSSSGAGGGIAVGGLPARSGGRATGEAAVVELRIGIFPQDDPNAYDPQALLGTN